MVCPRCILVVRQELSKLQVEPVSVELGKVELPDHLSNCQLLLFQKQLKALGFDLLKNNRQREINEVKTWLIKAVQEAEIDVHFSIKQYLSARLTKGYTYVSKHFSELEGITIEQFFILQKIEKVKELLSYEEMPLKEIAGKLGYNSIQYLSHQFRQVAGMSPSNFKKAGYPNRRPVDDLVTVPHKEMCTDFATN